MATSDLHIKLIFTKEIESNFTVGFIFQVFITCLTQSKLS